MVGLLIKAATSGKPLKMRPSRNFAVKFSSKSDSVVVQVQGTTVPDTVNGEQQHLLHSVDFAFNERDDADCGHETHCMNDGSCITTPNSEPMDSCFACQVRHGKVVVTAPRCGGIQGQIILT